MDDTFELVPETVRVPRPKKPFDTYAIARLKTEEGVRHVCKLAGIDPDKGAHAWNQARAIKPLKRENKPPEANYLAMMAYLDATGLFNPKEGASPTATK